MYFFHPAKTASKVKLDLQSSLVRKISSHGKGQCCSSWGAQDGIHRWRNSFQLHYVLTTLNQLKTWGVVEAYS